MMISPLKGKRIFVTGGSGFIGTRLIESLVLDHGALVTALVNSANAGALRMARFNVNFAFGDIRDPAAMCKATSGSDVIIHMAYGRSGSEAYQESITVGGTQAMVQAALTNGVKRFVNVSTAAVYYGAPDGLIDETAPRRKWGWSYSDSKLEAENLVLDAVSSSGLPGTVVQVAGVYGPWGGTFTINPLTQLQTGTVVLVDGGSGVTNATYVDDTVQGLLLAASQPGVEGEIFIIKGPGRVTRRDFFSAYEKILGYTSTIEMSITDIHKMQRSIALNSLKNAPAKMISAIIHNNNFKDALRSLPLPAYSRNFLRKFRVSSENYKTAGSPLTASCGIKSKQLFFPPSIVTKYYSAQVEFSTSKAERLLGYRPMYDLEAGMALTAEWARWARVIK